MKKIKSDCEERDMVFAVYVNREVLKGLLINLYKKIQPGDDPSFSVLLGKLMILTLECDHTCILDDSTIITLKGFEELFKLKEVKGKKLCE